MSTLISVVHVCTCFLLVLVILIQSGKGAEISASLGGSSQTVFGSAGGANFFTRFTSIAAAIFMTTSVALTMIANRANHSIFEGVARKAAVIPAKPTAPLTATGSSGSGAAAPANGASPGSVPATGAAPSQSH